MKSLVRKSSNSTVAMRLTVTYEVTELKMIIKEKFAC